MADRTVTAEVSVALGARRITLRPAVAVGAVYLAARLVTTVFLLIGAVIADRHTSGATIGSLSMRWDGQWYWLVGVNGYPTELPRDDSGAVTQNAWAFMPLYPAISRVLSFVLGGQYPIAAIVVAIVAGYFACLALHHLLREGIDGAAALWAVAFLAAGPLAALFQMGYAESLFLLWLFLALLMLVRRRYGWLYLLIPLMGFTRPGVLAFALLLGLYGIVRWFRRRTDPLPATEAVHIVFLGLLAVVVGFAWQVIAGYVTGDPQAYLETELAWRRDWTGGDGGFSPFQGFVQASAIWFRVWGLPEVWGYAALAAVVAAVAVALLVEPHVRRLGPEVRLWSASYLFYLLLVFFPQSSIFRLLMPMAPLYGALAVPADARRNDGGDARGDADADAEGATPRRGVLVWRVAVLVVGLVGQWWWIDQMLIQGTTYTQIP